jgi:hypothetical protein
MKTIRLIGHVDEQHRLCAEVPSILAPGPVEVVVVLPPDHEDDAGDAWTSGIACQWAAELGDPREDLYTNTIADGEPIDGLR